MIARRSFTKEIHMARMARIQFLECLVLAGIIGCSSRQERQQTAQREGSNSRADVARSVESPTKASAGPRIDAKALLPQVWNADPGKTIRAVETGATFHGPRPTAVTGSKAR